MRKMIASFVFCATLIAQPARELEEAHQAEAGGHFELALRLYEDVRRAARAAGESPNEADAALNTARVLLIWAAADDSQKTRLSEALLAYEDADRLGTPAQKISARN